MYHEGVGSGNWCLAILGKMKKWEEIALEAWEVRIFNPPCPTLLTQANRDLCDSQERKDLNITLPTTVLTNPQCDHIINEVGGLQTSQDPLRVSRVSMKLYFRRIFIFDSLIWFSTVSIRIQGEICLLLFLYLGNDLPNSFEGQSLLVFTC